MYLPVKINQAIVSPVIIQFSTLLASTLLRSWASLIVALLVMRIEGTLLQHRKTHYVDRHHVSHKVRRA
jgi:preprotein translocase subunit SecY